MKTPHSPRVLQTLLLLLVLTCAPAAVAQDVAPGVFSEIIDVRVVNVEVVVEDKQGLRVQGLGPQDFQLFIDGNEVPIEYFTEVRGSQAIAAAPGSSGPAGLPELAPGEPVGTSYLVFIDDFFALAVDRNKVLEGLAAQLGQIGANDRMAIVRYDGKALQMLTSWTNSLPALERALKEAQRYDAQGLKRRVERQSMERNSGLDVGIDDFPGSLRPLEREYVVDLTRQVERAVSAAAATLRSFAKPPGRTVMLLLSGGWPLDPAVYAIGATRSARLGGGFFRGARDVTLPITEPGMKRGELLVAPLVTTANRLGYTLYPVDVPGLGSTLPEVSAEAAGQTPGIDFREHELHATLNTMAEQTGGRALLNAARVDGLNRVVEDIQSYYWLGFTPQRKRDDTAHEIEVRPRREGLRVRTREGYVDLSMGGEVGLLVESSLLFGSTPTTGTLPVQLGQATKSGRGTMELPITVGIPADQLTFLAAGGGYAAKVELRFGVLDSNGDSATVPAVPIELTTKEPPKAGSLVRYDTKLQLRRLNHRLVIALYEPLSGKVLSTTLEAKAP